MTITRAVTIRIVDLTLDEMSRELPGGAMGQGLYDGWGDGNGSGKGDAPGYCTISSLPVNGELVHTGRGSGCGGGYAHSAGNRHGYGNGAGHDKTIASA